MTREAFIKKYLANKDFTYCEESRDEMRDDLDEVINYYCAKGKQIDSRPYDLNRVAKQRVL